jgi:serine/threonine-protein kinase
MPFVDRTRPRERLANRYELQALIGAGAMGRVYRALDIQLDELVAVKVLARHLVDQDGMLRRFRREVKLARRITHQNVARVYDVGEHGADRFLTMELVLGESLGDLIAREGAPVPTRAVAIARAALAGLAAAHASAVIHRDFKPDNILVAQNGRIAITDFGIAAAYELGGALETTGSIVGTPAYMAPEQVEAAPGIGPAADIYAFGAVMYELLTGRRAWRGVSSLAVAAARLTRPPPDPRVHRPEISDGLADFVLRCMARAPADRPPSAEAASAELAALDVLAAGHDGRRLVVSIAPSRASASSVHDVESARTALVLSRPPSLALPGRHDRTLAVLPFENAAGPDDELVHGLIEEVVDRLSMMRGLRVRSAVTATRSAASGRDPRDVGRDLDVEVVAQGSVHRTEAGVRLTVRLIGVADGYQLWASTFEGSLHDLLAMAEALATSIAEALGASSEGRRLKVLTDPAAIDAYLRARAVSRRHLSPEAACQAVPLFEHALSLAPDNPIVLAGYAIARARQWYLKGSGRELALDAAARAIAAAPSVGEGYLASAIVHFFDGDPVKAMAQAKQAVALAPGMAEAHALVGRILAEIGFVSEATRRLEAVLVLDPIAETAYSDLSRVYALMGASDKADDLVGRMMRLNERVARLDRARLLWWRRDAEGAVEGLREIGASPDPLHRIACEMMRMLTDGTRPSAEHFLRFTSHAGGTERRRSLEAQLQTEVRAYFGEIDGALEALASAMQRGLIDLYWFEHCPLLEAVRQHPRSVATHQELTSRARRVLAEFIDGSRGEGGDFDPTPTAGRSS